MIPFLCRIVYITFFNKALDNGQLPTGLQAPPHAGVDSVPLLASVPGEAFVPREQGAISSPWHAIRHGRVLSREFVIPRQQHFLPQAKVWRGVSLNCKLHASRGGGVVCSQPSGSNAATMEGRKQGRREERKEIRIDENKEGSEGLEVRKEDRKK